MMCVSVLGVEFFFVKLKTAYEMRISDWSSDVCSSDLLGIGVELVSPAAGTASLPWIEPIGLLWLNALKMTIVPLIVALLIRSEERRVGQECVSTCRSR